MAKHENMLARFLSGIASLVAKLGEAEIAAYYLCAALSRNGHELQPRESCRCMNPLHSANEQATELLDNVALICLGKVDISLW